MKKLLLLLLVSASSFATENTLTPFKTDGCSIVPDFSFTRCCIIHDFDYYGGGTYEERKASDQRLRECVTEKSNAFMGNMFYWGVRLGGGPNRPTTFRWGYGWKHIRGYGPLTEKEKQMISEMLPTVAKNASHYDVTSPAKNYFEVPSQFGNYCLDQAFTQIDDHYKDSENKIFNIREDEDAYFKFLNIKMENEDTWQVKIKLRDWEYCQRPHYQMSIPDYIFSNKLIRKAKNNIRIK